jgi:hypothetical protein
MLSTFGILIGPAIGWDCVAHFSVLNSVEQIKVAKIPSINFNTKLWIFDWAIIIKPLRRKGAKQHKENLKNFVLLSVLVTLWFKETKLNTNFPITLNND